MGPLGGPVLLCSMTHFGHVIRWHRVTSSLRQAFSTAFHLSLLLVEWFFCCQIALWILDLEWAVAFCNWKFRTQRQFHWALSLFNTQSLDCSGSCGFLRRYLYCPHALNGECGSFSFLCCALELVQLHSDQRMSACPSLGILLSSTKGSCPPKSMVCLQELAQMGTYNNN